MNNKKTKIISDTKKASAKPIIGKNNNSLLALYPSKLRITSEYRSIDMIPDNIDIPVDLKWKQAKTIDIKRIADMTLKKTFDKIFILSECLPVLLSRNHQFL